MEILIALYGIIMKIVEKHYISLHARYRTANFKSASISVEARAERGRSDSEIQRGVAHRISFRDKTTRTADDAGGIEIPVSRRNLALE